MSSDNTRDSESTENDERKTDIKEWTEMGFGDSEGGGRHGKAELCISNVICGAPTTVKVKRLS